MNHTTYYQLSLWEQDDRIMREDFNDNNAKLDTAVKAANDRIDTKANAAALGAETTARENADTALGGRIDSEATARASADTALQNAIDTETAVRTAAVNAINANLGSHGHNCRIAWGSYTGNDTCGAAHPNTLTLDFCPVMLFLGTRDYERQGSDPTIFMRGRGGARSAYPSFGSSGGVNLTWGDNSISWYASSDAEQMNDRENPCFYVVLGYDKAAEEA